MSVPAPTVRKEPSPAEFVFMYQPVGKLQYTEQKISLAHNIANAVGYIPLVGVVVAIARMIFGAIKYFTNKNAPDTDLLNKMQREQGRFQVVRGLIELIPFAGLALLIADVANTVKFKQG